MCSSGAGSRITVLRLVFSSPRSRRGGHTLLGMLEGQGRKNKPRRDMEETLMWSYRRNTVAWDSQYSCLHLSSCQGV